MQTENQIVNPEPSLSSHILEAYEKWFYNVYIQLAEAESRKYEMNQVLASLGITKNTSEI